MVEQNIQYLGGGSNPTSPFHLKPMEIKPIDKNLAIEVVQKYE